jgi:hypothetical protein
MMMPTALFQHVLKRQTGFLKRVVAELENKITYDREDREFLESRAIEIANNLKRLRKIKNDLSGINL